MLTDQRKQNILEKLSSTSSKQRRLARLEREATTGIGKVTSRIPFTKAYRLKKSVKYRQEAALSGRKAKETGGMLAGHYPGKRGRKSSEGKKLRLAGLDFHGEMAIDRNQGLWSKRRAKMWSKGTTKEILKVLGGEFVRKVGTKGKG